MGAIYTREQAIYRCTPEESFKARKRRDDKYFINHRKQFWYPANIKEEIKGATEAKSKIKFITDGDNGTTYVLNATEARYAKCSVAGIGDW